ncbi:MAG: EMC3/TMCO1 family protein [Methanobrevibacter sp.]|nr:EMC3/TMCO1 family protein [Methanobrevibacter sp.]
MLTIFIISFIISVITTVANKYLVDQEQMKEMKERSKVLQAKLKEARDSGDPKLMAEVQIEQQNFMSEQTKMMGNSFKPMIVTMVPILLFFYWMWNSVLSKSVIILPDFVYWCLLTPLWQSLYGFFYHSAPSAVLPAGLLAVGWLSWYLLSVFAIGQVLRKVMGLSQ